MIAAAHRAKHRHNPAHAGTGIKFVLGVDKTGVSHVQSVLFPRSNWGENQAKAWLRQHGFSVPAVDETYEYWRFRQSDPNKFKRFATIDANPKRRNLFGFGKQSTSVVSSKAAYEAGLKSGDTGLFDAWFERSKWGKDRSLKASMRREYERGFEAEHSRAVSARRHSQQSETTRRTSLSTAPTSYKGAKIWRTVEGDWKTDLDRESSFDGEREVKAFVDSEKKRNPKDSFVACVERHRGAMGLSAAQSYCKLHVREIESERDRGVGKRFGGKRRRRNPEGAAAEKFEEFHGKPSGEEIIIEEEYRYHENLAALGDLCQIKCRTLSGYDASFDFAGYDEDSGNFDESIPASERPILCCSEDGRQLYVLGGDQEIDLGAIHMDSGKWPRDSMVIGDAYMVTYQTCKGFDDFELVSYFHELGEDTGVSPEMIYDKLNDQIQFAGGQYEVLPETGDADGLGGSLFN